MRIYISGPITGCENYEEIFAAAQEALEAKGHKVVNPARLCEYFPGGSHEQYMYIAKAALKCSRAIYLLPGWTNSEGALQELAWACEYNKTIFEEGCDGKPVPELPTQR